ncbi:MAG TPA: DUF4252 domain-containing protein [Pyrinomonadaceae bacterium]|nr:DUF4252 domain-containing protein [Pyrinomonadaceae bacterium]
MNILFQTGIRLSLLSLTLLIFAAAVANAQDPRVQTQSLDHLSNKASQTVNVNIDERLMQMTAKFFSSADPDEKKIKEIISGLKGIYVRVFEFEKENEYSPADVESIRVQLRNPGWSPIVTINSKKEGSVEVYLMTTNDRITGLAVLAIDPKELTVVNILGPVDLEKLTELEGQFGVPVLDIEKPAKTKVKN